MIDSTALSRARKAANDIVGELGLAELHAEYPDHEWKEGLEHLPTLHLEDVSAIPFVSVISGVEQYQHRARVRAGAGDLFASVVQVAHGYEAYCRDTLQLGDPEFLLTEPVGGLMEVARSCGFGRTHDRLVEVARDAGGLVIHPYMSITDTWELAEKLARDSGTPVYVHGPTPLPLWVANDKATLTELARRAAGDDFVVETAERFTALEMAIALSDFAERYERVGLKRTRCASAMGNMVFDSATVRTWDRTQTVTEVESFLGHTEWDGKEQVLIVPWVNTDLSPSTQLWLPEKGKGLPIVEGIYEQLLVGPEKVFLGSRPSRLPAALEETLADASILVAAGLQELGYVGRCSFDFIVDGDPESDFRAYFTECNGRWGGTSTPMRLLDRLFPQGRPKYRAQDYVHEKLVGMPFTEVLERVGDLAYDARSGKGRFVFYNVGPLAGSGKIDVISLADTWDEVERGFSEILPQALGIAV